jgi:hypothetical protein
MFRTSNQKEFQMSYYQHNYEHGLRGEALVIKALEDMGAIVSESTKVENVMEDIDCWITVDDEIFADIGVTAGTYALSIKRQDAGLKYGHFGFELMQQETKTDAWTNSGWYNTGAAPIYAVLQGSQVSIFLKTEVENILKQNKKWVRKAPLSSALRNAVNKHGRYKDAICGYLHAADFKNVIKLLLTY